MKNNNEALLERVKTDIDAILENEEESLVRIQILRLVLYFTQMILDSEDEYNIKENSSLGRWYTTRTLKKFRDIADSEFKKLSEKL